jgi:Zn-finger nucleic acid-binding protein
MSLCLFLSLAGNLWLEGGELNFCVQRSRDTFVSLEFKLYESFWKLFCPRVRFAWLQDQCRR